MIGSPLDTVVAGYRHLHLENVGSTNSHLAELAQNGEPGNLWVTADTQSSGKGSRGRRWQSDRGNLFCSLLLQNPAPSQHLHELTFVASLAVRDAIIAAGVDSPLIGLKWPNDVLVDGNKVSGILLEGGTVGTEPFVVIGIGVNCTSRPDKPLHKAASLQELGAKISAPDLFLEVSKSMSVWLGNWKGGDGFQMIRKYWLQHAKGIGEQVRVDIPGREPVMGRFTTIDERGYMMLETEGGEIERLSTADVFFADQSNTGD